MPLNLLFILNRMQLLYINFGDRNPPYPALGSNIPSAKRPGLRFNFLQCRGSSPIASVRFVNRHGGNPIKEGRVGCLHQNIFTRKVTDIAFTSDFFNNHYRPRVPCLTSSSPQSRVPKSPSPCPRPTFIHSPAIPWERQIRIRAIEEPDSLVRSFPRSFPDCFIPAELVTTHNTKWRLNVLVCAQYFSIRFS